MEKTGKSVMDWLKAPVTQDLDWGEILMIFALFAVVTWAVKDTLNILREGLS